MQPSDRPRLSPQPVHPRPPPGHTNFFSCLPAAHARFVPAYSVLAGCMCPLFRQANSPTSWGRDAPADAAPQTRKTGGRGRAAAAVAAPRRAFRPSGIAKSVALSPPPPSPSPPRTRKQSLERRESSQSPSLPRHGQTRQRPVGRRSSAAPSSQPTSTRRGGGDAWGQAPPPQPRPQYYQRRSQEGNGGGGRGGHEERRQLKEDDGVGRAGEGRREGERIRERGSAEQPFGAVYSRSFDTGEFFDGINEATPLGSPNNSTYPWEEGGIDRSGGGAGRFPRPSLGSRENGDGEVRGGTGTASGYSPRRSSHSGAWRGPDRRELSSYADFHAATTATATGTPAGRSWGGQEGRGHTATTSRYHHQRSGNGGGGGGGLGPLRGGAATRTAQEEDEDTDLRRTRVR